MNEYLIECRAQNASGTMTCVRTRRAPNASAAVESLRDYLKRIEHLEIVELVSVVRIDPREISIVELEGGGGGGGGCDATLAAS